MIDLAFINSLAKEKAREAFFHCSGSAIWTERMLSQRPFASEELLIEAAENAWDELNHDDWLEAFKIHPKIGDIDSLRKKFASTSSWAKNEQAGVNAAGEAVLERLADGNKRYEERFGYIFIVCATGKSAEEMALLLEERLGNKPESEFENAAGEQKKITRIRLEKLKA